MLGYSRFSTLCQILHAGMWKGLGFFTNLKMSNINTSMDLDNIPKATSYDKSMLKELYLLFLSNEFATIFGIQSIFSRDSFVKTRALKEDVIAGWRPKVMG